MPSQRSQSADDLSQSFGFKAVPAAEKQDMVDGVFHRVASRYDLMNDLMSAGMHRIWKDALVAMISPPRHGRGEWQALDVAGGTGDIAFKIVEASNKTVKATVFDINASMLDVGRERAEKNGLAQHLTFVEGNAEILPFEDNSFDAYTVAVGIRNVAHIDRALKEAYRILKPGGKFACLEFSRVDVPMLDKFYETWSFNAIPKIGEWVTHDRESYQYLVESIRKFPDQETFAQMIRNAGFERVGYRNLSGGIVAIHSGWKL